VLADRPVRRDGPAVIIGVVCALCVTLGAGIWGLLAHSAPQSASAAFWTSHLPELFNASPPRAVADLAESVLATWPLPSGAVDAKAVSGLMSPPSAPATAELVDAYKIWRWPGHDDVLGWYQAHRPPGSSVSGSGGSSGPGQDSQWTIFSLRATQADVDSITVLVGQVGLPGGVAFRVDVQVTWSPPRSAGEVIPSAWSTVIILASGPLPRPEKESRVITDVAQVAHLRTAVNSLSVAPSGIGGNGAENGAFVQLMFLPSAKAKTGIVVEEQVGAADSLAVTTSAGQDLQPLADPNTLLVTDALSLLGLPHSWLYGPGPVPSVEAP